MVQGSGGEEPNIISIWEDRIIYTSKWLYAILMKLPEGIYGQMKRWELPMESLAESVERTTS